MKSLDVFRTKNSGDTFYYNFFKFHSLSLSHNRFFFLLLSDTPRNSKACRRILYIWTKRCLQIFRFNDSEIILQNYEIFNIAADQFRTLSILNALNKIYSVYFLFFFFIYQTIFNVPRFIRVRLLPNTTYTAYKFGNPWNSVVIFATDKKLNVAKDF